MDLASMSPCTKKVDFPPKRDTEPLRAGRVRRCPSGHGSRGSGAELGPGAKAACGQGLPWGLSPPLRAGQPSPSRAAGAPGKCKGL